MKFYRRKRANYINASRINYHQYGITGTQLSGGRISGYEQNNNLVGLNWIREAEEMLRTDPIVFRCWHLLRQTLLSASWRFIPGIENDPVSEIYADYANECFGFDGYSGQMELSFEEQLSYLLQFIPIGYRYAEEIYKTGKDKNGNSRIWLCKFADREPSSHDQWLSRDGQVLDGVLQIANNVYINPEPIPSNKLLLLTFNKSGSNFEGMGMLRPAWFFWRTKQNTSTAMSIGVDRWAIPTPRVTVDRSVAEMQGLSDGDIDAMIDDAESQAAAFVAGEQSYLIENAAIKFDSYGVQPTQAAGPLEVIKECDNQISQAFFAQFSNLGISDTGARSVGEIHLSVFRRLAINLCDLVAGQINGKDRAGGGTIGRLIKFNFGEDDASKLPRLVHNGLDNDTLAESFEKLEPLVRGGILTPDDNLERSIRDKLGIGDLPNDAERSPFERSVISNPRLQGGSNYQSALLAEHLITQKKRKDHE